MKDFKFFRGYGGTLNVMDFQTYATASIYYTPPTLTDEERLTQINERIQRSEDFRNHGIITHEQYMRNRDMMIEQERVRRRLIDSDNQIRLFQATTVTTVNPKWWMKVKMFFQKLSLYSDQVVPITVIATTITFIVILVISKILSVW
jgi:hypothetical protein